MKQETETISVVFAGHKDHGKSSLVGRLLLDVGQVPDSCRREALEACRQEGKEFQPAFLIDRLLDERQDGLTLCPGRAFIRKGDRHYELVDPPGHRELVREMLMGATLADVAILVVDITEGIAEQTRRHATYLRAVGLDKLIVVVNKMDIVGFRFSAFEPLMSSLTCLLRAAGLEPIHFIPASALGGQNVVHAAGDTLDWYEGPTVLQALEACQAHKASRQPFRFPVQDVYEVEGEEMLVGRVEAGTVRTGDEVVLLPDGRQCVVRSLHRFDGRIDSASAGQSIGLRLGEAGCCCRGTVLCDPSDLPAVSEYFRADVLWTSELPLASGEALTLRCTTQEAECRIDFVESVEDTDSTGSTSRRSATLREHQIGTARLRCQRPLVIEAYGPSVALGRFILERQGRVVAGGLVSPAGLRENP